MDVVNKPHLRCIRVDPLSIHQRLRIAGWCSDTFGGRDQDYSWWVDGNTFYFRDEYDYLIFLLRWSNELSL